MLIIGGLTNCATALNTLDLLKKGTSALAQRARAASRILVYDADSAAMPPTSNLLAPWQRPHVSDMVQSAT